MAGSRNPLADAETAGPERWRRQASCLGLQELWLDPDPGNVDTVLRACGRCPVQVQCAATALGLADAGIQPVGIWAGIELKGAKGGTDGDARRALHVAELRRLAGAAPPSSADGESSGGHDG